MLLNLRIANILDNTQFTCHEPARPVLVHRTADSIFQGRATMDRRQQHRRVNDLLQQLTQAFPQWTEADGRVADYLTHSIQLQLDELRRALALTPAASRDRRAA